MTNKPSGGDPAPSEPHADAGRADESADAPTARGVGLGPAPRRTASGTALIANRIVVVDRDSGPAKAAKATGASERVATERVTSAPETGDVGTTKPLGVVAIGAAPAPRAPSIAPSMEPPVRVTPAPVIVPRAAAETAPLPVNIERHSVRSAPMTPALFQSSIQPPPSSLPQSLSALLVELLRCAVAEGPDQQARMKRGLERAIELRRQTELAARRLSPASMLAPPGSVLLPGHSVLLPSGPVALPLSVLPVSEPPLTAPLGAHADAAPLSLTSVLHREPTSEPPPSLSESMIQLLNRSFSGHAGPDSQLDLAGLANALQLRNSYLAERMLAAFDKDGDGVVNRAEFLLGVRRLVFGTTRDKLRFAFHIHDLNGDSMLDRNEVQQMIRLSLLEEQSEGTPVDASRLTELLFIAADQDGDGRLSFEDFEALVNKHPALLKTITQSEARWIAPSEDLLAKQNPPTWLSRVGRVFANRGGSILLVSLWAALSSALFVEAAVRHHAAGSGVWIALARGAGAALNFSGALILLPVMRRMLTWLRQLPGFRGLPWDDAIGFHRLLGITLFVLSLVHGAAHLVNYALGPTGIVKSLQSGPGLTGSVLLGVFTAMWWFSRRSIRKSGAFELFYFTHLLYVPWVALALLHGPRFWQWAGAPIAGFLVEQIWRRLRTGQPAEVFDAEALVSGVTRLKIRPPQGFTHRAGDYLFLRLPALAPHEWHPFTISSAPERQNLTLHIRSLGNFTLALRQFVEDRQVRRDRSPLPAYIDGPYGTCSGQIRETRYAVLIGAGIGVTPFTSVLESVVLRSQAGYTLPEKVHFYWLNKDAHSFEWFADLLFQIESIDERRCVEINIYMTEGRGNITAVALNLAREVSHALGHPDLVTGLRSQTHMGNPDWHAELARIKALYAPEPVDVFFCGPPGLARKIRTECERLRLRFRQEHF